MNTTKTAFVLFASLLIISCQKDQIENYKPVVDAGRDSTINSTDTISLSGKATDSDGSIDAYVWSQVSGPNTATIVAAGSAKTYAINIQAGTYVFQLMATDNKGATGVKSISVTVLPPQILTSTIQSNPNQMEALLAVDYRGNRSDPAPPELSAAAWTSGGSAAYTRGLFKFDLSGLPSTAKIVSAKLTLYSNPTPLNGDQINANYGTNNSMLIQRVVSQWSNTTVGWNNQPAGDATTQIVIPHTTISRLDLTDLDVTNLVKAMVQTDNYGFLLRLQNESGLNSRIFSSSRYTDVSKRPKLVLQYTK